MNSSGLTPEFLNEFGMSFLPGHLGIVITSTEQGKIIAEMNIRSCLLAPNGYLHAGSVVAFADTCAGYGCVYNLPEGANGFTTIELKSNHMGTAREGFVDCVASVLHLGKSTQVWDAQVTSRESGKTIALFRCTQMILYPK